MALKTQSPVETPVDTPVETRREKLVLSLLSCCLQASGGAAERRAAGDRKQRRGGGGGGEGLLHLTEGRSVSRNVVLSNFRDLSSEAPESGWFLSVDISLASASEA